jgi:hypothetical protein
VLRLDQPPDRDRLYTGRVRALLRYRDGRERPTELGDLTTETVRLAGVVRGRQATRVVKR